MLRKIAVSRRGEGRLSGDGREKESMVGGREGGEKETARERLGGEK